MYQNFVAGASLIPMGPSHQEPPSQTSKAGGHPWGAGVDLRENSALGLLMFVTLW